MGSPLQQIFPGRGDKKGKGLWVKAAAVALLGAAWACLFFDFPVLFPRIWFPLSAAAVAVCGVLHLLSRRRDYAIEFLFSLLLLYAGIIDWTGLLWLRLALFPFIIVMSGFYSRTVIIPLSFLAPFNELRTFVITQEDIAGEAAFFLSLVLTAVAASFIFTTLRREKENAAAELDQIRAGARDRTRDTEMESLGSDEIISHYFASKIKANEEMQDLLHAIRQAVFADAAHFFEPNGDSFALRCSTDDKGKIIITGKGIMATCQRERKPFYSDEVNEKTVEVGYIRNGKVVSLIAMPVMEGSTPVGILAVDSSRYHAFNDPERKTVQMFSGQIARILERQRVYTIIKHDITALRIIKEFSAGIASSILYDDIIRKLSASAEKAFSGRPFFLDHGHQGFGVKHFPGEFIGSATHEDFAGTLIRLAVDNRQKEYVSDVRQYAMKIFPPQLRAEAFRSVIAVPLFHEGELLGVFGMIARQREFLDSRQMSLVEVMCNQASTSIANARLHARIERLATQDSLTGLLNHRVFQEKVSEELKRAERYETPLSLLLTDIDHFKQVNDMYGHPTGDLVLKGVAKILREAIREIDVAARYGGEEFAVILPGTDGSGAKKIAERLRKTIMAEIFSNGGKTLSVTTSIGIAAVPADARTKEDLIAKADQALYYAKHHGRNQSVNWEAVR